MRRTFKSFYQVFNSLVARSQACVQRERSHNESLLPLWSPAGLQAFEQKAVHSALERIAGAPDLVLYLPRDIVVYGESLPHIMMIARLTS